MKRLLTGALVAFATAAGIYSANVSAQEPSKTWSVVVHFEYADGFSYDYVLATGIPTSQMHAMLAECGQSHWVGSVVRYHCFPIPE